MSRRVSPTERIRAEIDALFDADRDLVEVLEDVARRRPVDCGCGPSARRSPARWRSGRPRQLAALPRQHLGHRPVAPLPKNTTAAALRVAHGGARPLLDTLAEYFACGGVATETARRLHIGVRTVGYRLDRVRELTGYGTTEALERYTLETAVLGARLLGWPDGDVGAHARQ